MRVVMTPNPPSFWNASVRAPAFIASVVKPSMMLVAVNVVFGGMYAPTAAPKRAPRIPNITAPVMAPFLLTLEVAPVAVEAGESANCWSAVESWGSWALRFVSGESVWFPVKEMT